MNELAGGAISSIAIDGVDIPIILRINSRAKRIILKVDSLKRQILVTCPSKRMRSEALAFAQSRARWIESQLAGGPVAIPFAAGVQIPFEGVATRISYIATKTQTTRLDPIKDEILVSGGPETINDEITRWLKRQARAAFEHHVREFCQRLNVGYSKLSIRDTKTRWGSCASDGALSFSWRLILAPASVLRYVAAHEVAHLVHHDHSKAFWVVLDRLVDNRRSAESWLTSHGASLYGFGVARADTGQS